MALEKTYASLLAARASKGHLRKLTLPSPAVDFSSNSYLSLSSNPKVKSAYVSNLQSQTTDFGLGSGGSRLLDGNSAAAEALECNISAFHGAPAGLLFNSGFEANTGLFGCAPQRGDVVVYDELVHASTHDGIRLSRGRGVAFSHNCVHGGDGSLDDVLGGLVRSDPEIKAGRRNVFVAVEGVYSMDGDVAPLLDIVECVERRLPGNGYVIVDEAHSTGVLGERGRGLVCQLGLERRVWARVHTFGKAMGCSGAIVLCSPVTRSYLINYARSLIYTTAMSPPLLTAIKTSYDFLASGDADPLRDHLHSLMRYTHEVLSSLCERHQPPRSVFYINNDQPESPIIPLFTGQPAPARSLAAKCQDAGFLVRPIVAPTVPVGTDRVRLCLHAGNTFLEVDGLCRVVEEWVVQQLDAVAKSQPGRGGQTSSPETQLKSRL